eukprot:CAMPEP_0184492380 /NCGR_PEP_ID=MMETSP0113_2-20130426/23057_1 /TAXON_ID=91329 /ORGANISM="Norrisiella sphaerica, Strain BC52" /LENGTH=448 /DNA_ID=CAMNT_0026877145 /DNA_START=309 /DNA_END=1651 /DNA_ORIENTATION=-
MEKVDKVERSRASQLFDSIQNFDMQYEQARKVISNFASSSAHKIGTGLHRVWVLAARPHRIESPDRIKSPDLDNSLRFETSVESTRFYPQSELEETSEELILGHAIVEVQGISAAVPSFIHSVWTLKWHSLNTDTDGSNLLLTILDGIRLQATKEAAILYVRWFTLYSRGFIKQSDLNFGGGRSWEITLKNMHEIFKGCSCLASGNDWKATPQQVSSRSGPRLVGWHAKANQCQLKRILLRPVTFGYAMTLLEAKKEYSSCLKKKECIEIFIYGATCFEEELVLRGAFQVLEAFYPHIKLWNWTFTGRGIGTDSHCNTIMRHGKSTMKFSFFRGALKSRTMSNEQNIYIFLSAQFSNFPHKYIPALVDVLVCGIPTLIVESSRQEIEDIFNILNESGVKALLPPTASPFRCKSSEELFFLWIQGNQDKVQRERFISQLMRRFWEGRNA